jgi:ribosomal protein S18 acetylase RimI-like enzyme
MNKDELLLSGPFPGTFSNKPHPGFTGKSGLSLLPAMYLFSDKDIHIAGPGDIPFLNKLLNSAYRGESSKKGWTTEAFLIAGETRTSEADLQEIMNTPGAVFLKCVAGNGQICGCLCLRRYGDRIHLGMFAVSPLLQGTGLGKRLLSAAEEYTRFNRCRSIFMSVITVRDELIAWYMRHGYADTGERKEFVEDGLTGRHLQPLEFMILEKPLATSPS